MTWKVLSVQMEDFLPFKKQSLDMSEYRGLTFVSGFRGAGKSNGSGKTALFCAITWAIWGETPKNLSSVDKVIRKGADSCTVKVLVKDELGEVTITRTRGKRSGSLIVEGFDERATMDGQQAAICSRFGTYQEFLSTSMFCGAASSFCRLTDADRKELLEKMAGLGHYDHAKDAADLQLKDILERGRDAELDLQRLQSREELAIERRQAALFAKLTARSKLFQQARVLRKEASAAGEKALRKFSALGDALIKLRSDAKAAQAEAKSFEHEAEDIEESATSLKKTADALRERIGGISVKIKDQSQELESLEDGEHPEMCPTCGQRWGHDDDHDASVAVMEKLRSSIADLKKEKGIAIDELQDLDDRLASLFRMSKDLRKKSEAARMRVDKEATRTVYSEAFEADAVWKESAKRLAEVESKITDPEDDEVDSDNSLDEVEAIRAEIKSVSNSIANLLEEKKMAEFWKAGFSRTGLPAFLIDSVVPGMSETAAEIASDLTDGELVVSFNSTATKGAKSVFQVNVEYTSGGDGFDAASRGEQTRVDMAVLFAIRDMAARRGRPECEQMFLDEIMDGADEAFVFAFIRMLRSRYGNKDIFLISHEPSAASLCDHTITVKKTGPIALLS